MSTPLKCQQWYWVGKDVGEYAYTVKLDCCDILSTPIRRAELDIVVGIAGVTDVGKMKKHLAVGRNRIALALARRSKPLQFLCWVSAFSRQVIMGV